MTTATQQGNGTATDAASFEGWCIVELFGHQQIAGKVSEKSMFGTSLMRIDVPAVGGRPAFTKFFGGGAIYALTPVQELVARAMAEALDEPPIQEWRLKTIDVSRQLESPHDDDSLRDYKTHHVTQVECYVSGSGNTTWKAYDKNDWLIYLRQSHRELLEDAGLWDDLNRMAVGDAWEADIIIHTVQDGDFRRPVLIDDGSKVIVPSEDLHSEPDALAPDRQRAIEWARELLKSPFVIFDTETSGVDENGEIIQIGIIDQDGETVFESLIRPNKPITDSHLHGITDAMVKDAPLFSGVYRQIKDALEGKTVVAYNLDFDARMLRQVIDSYGPEYAIEPIAFGEQHCAMHWYAQYNGEWSDYHSNYRWVKLRDALADFGLKHEEFGTKEHDACTDARATLGLIRKMAGEEMPF